MTCIFPASAPCLIACQAGAARTHSIPLPQTTSVAFLEKKQKGFFHHKISPIRHIGATVAVFFVYIMSSSPPPASFKGKRLSSHNAAAIRAMKTKVPLVDGGGQLVRPNNAGGAGSPVLGEGRTTTTQLPVRRGGGGAGDGRSPASLKMQSVVTVQNARAMLVARAAHAPTCLIYTSRRP